MVKQDKDQKKIVKKLTKNDLPVLDSGRDLFSVFLEPPPLPSPDEKKGASEANPRLNKHGLPVIEEFEEQFLDREGGLSVVQNVSSESLEPEELEEDFALLLEESLKQKKSPDKKKPIPMPIKKRLKRYPPPEAELDLHGFTALGAEVKAKSFISTCKHQGYFSLRIIVGKGLHSDSGPVLPDVIEDLLKILEKQNVVLAYKWDQQKKSKSGAVIVYLKQFNN